MNSKNLQSKIMMHMLFTGSVSLALLIFLTILPISSVSATAGKFAAATAISPTTLPGVAPSLTPIPVSSKGPWKVIVDYVLEETNKVVIASFKPTDEQAVVVAHISIYNMGKGKMSIFSDGISLNGYKAGGMYLGPLSYCNGCKLYLLGYNVASASVIFTISKTELTKPLIVEVSNDKSEPIALRNPVSSGKPAPTPTGAPVAIEAPLTGEQGKIAFVYKSQGKRKLYTVDPSGENLEAVSDLPANASAVKWSPDRSYFLFAAGSDGGGFAQNANRDIYKLEVGSKKKPINLTNRPGDDFDFSWSPDGKQILFMSRRDKNAEIYIMDTDGKNVRNLTNNANSDSSPVWSPDGKLIAFVSNRDNPKTTSGISDIYIMQPDGVIVRRLTDIYGGFLSIDWTANGRYIIGPAYSEHIGYFDKSDQLRITSFNFDNYAVNVETGEIRRVTNTRRSFDNILAPDGNSFVYSDRFDAYTNYVLRNFEGDTISEFRTNQTSVLGWSPDSKHLIAVIVVAGKPNLYVMDPDQTHFRQVTDFKAVGELSEVNWVK